MKATIFTGKSFGHRQLNKHPLEEVKEAKRLIDEKKDFSTFTNSPEFCLCAKNYGEDMGFEVEFLIDGFSVGSDLEQVMAHFSEAFDYLDKITITK